MKPIHRNADTIFLVSCVGKKQSAPAPARHLYTSEWFLRARAYVERQEAPWFILSAKLGLVSPDQIVEPYEQTLNEMPIINRRAWASVVMNQMDEMLPNANRCIAFAGQRYREFLMDYLLERFDTEVPMCGLAIGRQLQWLGSH